MKHPNPKIQKEQEEFLNNCSDDQRDFHARFFRIGNAAYLYHKMATSIDKIPGKYYHEWLEGLPKLIVH